MAETSLAYHRLLRYIPNHRWWKPLVFGVLAVVFGFTLTQMLVIVAAIPLVLSGGTDGLLEMQDRIIALDTQDPFALAVALLSLVVWIPAILLAALAMGYKPVGRVWSVAFKIRWRLIFKTALAAILVLILIQLIAGLYLTATEPETFEAVLPKELDMQKAMISLVLILVLVPLQATAEELMFRGIFMQVLGAWIRSPIPVIIIPAIAFAMGHLYDPLGLMQVGAMGLVAGWLTWRTGGLEAAISLHVVNNLLAFGILLSGVTGETSQGQETGTDWISLLIQVLGFVLYAAIVTRIVRNEPSTLTLYGAPIAESQ